MLFMGMPFLVDALQGLVDLPKFRRQQGEVSAGIGGNLFAAMNTGVFLDVGGDILGNAVVMAEEGAENFLH